MILGIDTSCYTTSLALLDDAGELIKDCRRLLQVKSGERGLRQSEAVFQHLQNLPFLLEQIMPAGAFKAIAVAARPRPVPESYLPVFQAGANFAATWASLLGVPLFKTSHQEGHIRAGLADESWYSSPFLTWHLSGGTTELLVVKPNANGYQLTKVGGSSDLQVGQFVDRVGVALGLAFPAGPALESLAAASQVTTSLPVVTEGLSLSFSGPESAAQRLITTGVAAAELGRQVFNCINQSVLQVTIRAAATYQLNRVLLVGGVAANQLLREYLQSQALISELEFYFGPPELASDNAVGVALLAHDYLQRGHCNGAKTSLT